MGIPRAALLQCINCHQQEAPSFSLCTVQVETQHFQWALALASPIKRIEMTPDRPVNSDPCRSPYNRPYFHLRNRAEKGSVVFLNWGSEPLLKTLQKTACFTHCLLHRLQIISKMRGARWQGLAQAGAEQPGVQSRAQLSPHCHSRPRPRAALQPLAQLLSPS